MLVNACEFDIRTIKREELTSIDSIEIDENMTPKERAESFLKQLGGQYCYVDDGVVVAFGYADTDVNLTSKLVMYASSLG